MPGHEIVGRVTKIGAKISKFKEGDLVAVHPIQKVNEAHERMLKSDV